MNHFESRMSRRVVSAPAIFGASLKEVTEFGWGIVI
jgi:hypothetical protein